MTQPLAPYYPIVLADIKQLQSIEPDEHVTLSLIILDASGSMLRFGSTPQNCVNEHLRKLQNSPDGRIQYCMVISFSTQYRIELPLVKITKDKTVKMEHYDPKDDTLLWKTVYKTIKLFLNDLPKKENIDLKIIMGVFTDGEDNQSPRDEYPLKLQLLANKAKLAGWELLTFGIGVNAEYLAQEMGFPDDKNHAITVGMDAKGISEATQVFTTKTTSFFNTRAYAPPKK